MNYIINHTTRFKELFTFMLLSFIIQTGVLALGPMPPNNLTGEDMRKWLRENWYDGQHQTLGYNGANGARAMMYAYIDNHDDSLTCVYSGHKQYWANGNTGTNPAPVNCEHTVPQSFFDSKEPMRSDIHHLFPTHQSPNSSRSNHPFDDINDEIVKKWHGNENGIYHFIEEPDQPAPNIITFYSERTSNGVQRFEPREDHKGDVARAIFYFYTMYEDNNNVIKGINDIVVDLETLCKWHLQDPVDEKEATRNDQIEIYQGNRNPFVDYEWLAAKAWDLESCVEQLLCMPNQTIDYLIDVDKNFQASKNIYGVDQNSIEPGVTVKYKAGYKISLQPSFHAKNGSYFRAYIGPCEDNFEFNMWENNDYPIVSKTKQVASEYDFLESGTTVYPNPFTDQLNLRYRLVEPTLVQLTIRDAMGETIYQSNITQFEKGTHTFTIESSGLRAGLYSCNLQLGDHLIQKTIIKNE